MFRTLFFLIVFSIAASFALGQSAADEPGSVDVAAGGSSVAMDVSLRKPVVDVMVNGKGPFRFFLDTGAGATVFNQDLVDELKLPADGKTRIGDPADPQGIEATRNRVAELEVGGTKFRDFIAVSWDRSILYRPGAPRGVLGMPLFRKLLLTIDYPGGKVRIEKGSLPAADGKRVIDYQIGEAGLIALPITVAGKPMAATIDSGSQSLLSFPESYKETLPLAGEPVEVGRGRTVAGEAVISQAPLKGDVKFGEYELKAPDVRFFGRLRNPNIGYEFLNPYAVSIDQANRRIRFEKGPAKPATPPDAKLVEYTGTYGVRTIAAEGGDLFLQRTGGPKIKLIFVRKDEYGLDMPGMTDVRVKFVRSSAGTVEQLSVLTPQGEWESSRREM